VTQAVAAAASSLQVVDVGELVAVKATEVVAVFRICAAVGELIVTTGAGVGAVTVKVVVAEPTLPAASVAETTIVWLATERPL
jgi:hypothetical protein